MNLRSPAKINLYLEVTGKRPDGYHNLITLMCFIGLFDSLHVIFGKSRISVTCSNPDVPQDENNLAFQAARLFLDASRIQEGVHIEIEKSIPVGAGLGGGSSNAAAVLLGLNAHYGSPYPINALSKMGKRLGADVPFFIFGGPAVATGIGDKLMHFNNLISYSILLIYPSVTLSTAEVYQTLNLPLTKNKKINTNTIFKLDWGRHAPKLLRNDLEAAAIALCLDIQTAKQILLEAGALGAMMTGSGSCVFGLFENMDLARRAYSQVSSDRPEWQVFLTQMTV
jgi:4-diphosphocytidyl-2-C-methyl-D-erythritol kinase